MGKGHSKTQDCEREFLLARDRLCQDFLEAKRIALQHCEEEVDDIKRQYEEEVSMIQNKYDRDVQLLKINVMREKERAKHERNFFEQKLVEALNRSNKQASTVDEAIQTESPNVRYTHQGNDAVTRELYDQKNLIDRLITEDVVNQQFLYRGKVSPGKEIIRQLLENIDSFSGQSELVNYFQTTTSNESEAVSQIDGMPLNRDEYEDDVREGTGDSGTEVEYSSEQLNVYPRKRKLNRGNYWQTKYFDMQRKYNKKMIDMEQTYSEQKRLLLESMNKEKLNLQDKHIWEIKDINDKFLKEIDTVRKIEREKYKNSIALSMKEQADLKSENERLCRELEEYKHLVANVLPDHNNEMREALFKLQEVLLVTDHDT